MATLTEYSIYESGFRDAPYRIEYRCGKCGSPAVGFGTRPNALFPAMCPNLHVTAVDASRPPS